MLKRTLMIAAVLSAVAGPALAGQCPKLMSEVDQALAGSHNLNDEQLAEVRRLRAEGEEHHEAGRHAESEQALNEAKEILGIN